MIWLTQSLRPHTGRSVLGRSHHFQHRGVSAPPAAAGGRYRRLPRTDIVAIEQLRCERQLYQHYATCQ